jgi:hypothetical protein
VCCQRRGAYVDALVDCVYVMASQPSLTTTALHRSLYLWVPEEEADVDARQERANHSAQKVQDQSFVFFDADPGPSKKKSKRGGQADDDGDN